MFFNNSKKLFGSSKNIFIFGLGQSGTFLVSDLLSYSMYETHAFHSVPPLRKKGLCNKPELIQKLGIKQCLQEGLIRYWDRSLNNLYLDAHKPCLNSFDSYKINPLHKFLIKNRYLRMLRFRNKYILDKCPNYLNILPAIHNIFPNATHLFVVRNPRLTINSQLKRLSANNYDFPSKND